MKLSLIPIACLLGSQLLGCGFVAKQPEIVPGNPNAKIETSLAKSAPAWSIKLPDGWETLKTGPDPDGAAPVVLLAARRPGPPTDLPTTAMVFGMRSDDDPKTYATRMARAAIKNPTNAVADGKKVKVGKLPGIFLLELRRAEGDKLNVVGELFVSDGKTGYVVSCGGDAGSIDDWSPDCDRIMSSFAVKE